LATQLSQRAIQGALYRDGTPRRRTPSARHASNGGLQRRKRNRPGRHHAEASHVVERHWGAIEKATAKGRTSSAMALADNQRKTRTELVTHPR